MKDPKNLREKHPELKTLWEIIKTRREAVRLKDIVRLAAVTLLSTALSLVFPYLTKRITGEIPDSGQVRLLLSIGAVLLSAELFSQVLSAVKTEVSATVKTGIKVSAEAAVMRRVFSLPLSFFRKYPSGELRQRVSAVGSLCEIAFGGLLYGTFSAVVSLLFVTQIFAYAPALTVPALLFTFLTVLIQVLCTVLQERQSRARMEAEAKESGLSFALVRGAVKLKEAGAEDRAFSLWEDAYLKKAAYEYDPPLLLKLDPVLMTALKLCGTLVFYVLSANTGVTVSDYLAFIAAYGGLTSAFSSLTNTGLSFAELPPVLSLAKPVLRAVPKDEDSGEEVEDLKGGITLSHVTFRYDKDGSAVLSDLSLKIKPGEYIGIAGKTGCGKTTLIRLLTGLETPESGEIFFDGKNMEDLSLRSLRKRLGVALQDGKLFQGEIGENIALGMPGLSEKEIWEAAEMAGIADDIRAMPLKLETPVSEGAGGLSGGQRQRLLIARAVAKQPRVLILDEATSALDSGTEKRIAKAVEKLSCTRIVVAHRPSTLRRCDRILYLKDGKIEEA